MKIAIAQMNCLLGDLSGNASKILDYVNQAKTQGIDLLLTPELSLTGYPPEDLLLRPGFLNACQQQLQQLALQISGITLVVGHPTWENGHCYNSASVIQNKQIIANYHKQHLPNHEVFDEARYFSTGQDATVFELKGIKFAINICEDIWHEDPANQAKQAGAQAILVLNASPFDYQKHHTRLSVVAKRAQESQLPIFYANLVGAQDELVFDGGSFALSATGDVVAQADWFSEDILLIDFSNQQISCDKICTTLSQEAATYQALCLGVKDYVRKNNFPGILLGLSGGIDSALTLAIAVDALGADKAHAVMMPSPYTAQISLDDSREMVSILGVRYDEFEIETIFQQYLSLLHPCFNNLPSDTTEENLQARIRGMLLMALSNKFGSVVLTTGNKSEMSVGYATLYGDMAGGFAVLKDVPKTLVYRLAQYRNSLSHVIPERIITRPPSAELRENQTDQDSLPAYEVLDAIVEAYMEQNKSIQAIINLGFHEADVRKVVRLIRLSEYKRRQSAVGVKITPRAYGKDWRYPITTRYQDDF